MIKEYNLLNKYNLIILLILFIINVVLYSYKLINMNEQDKTNYYNTLKLLDISFNIKWFYLIALTISIVLLIQIFLQKKNIKSKYLTQHINLLTNILNILLNIIFLSANGYLYFCLLYSIYYLNNIQKYNTNNK